MSGQQEGSENHTRRTKQMDTQQPAGNPGKQIRGKDLDSLTSEEINELCGGKLTEEEVSALELFVRTNIKIRMKREHVFWFLDRLPETRDQAKRVYSLVSKSKKEMDNLVASHIMGWAMGAYAAFFGTNDEICSMELRALIQTLNIDGKHDDYSSN